MDPYLCSVFNMWVEHLEFLLLFLIACIWSFLVVITFAFWMLFLVGCLWIILWFFSFPSDVCESGPFRLLVLRVTVSDLFLILVAGCFMLFSSFYFPSLDVMYMSNLFTKKLILHILCSCGWQESKAINQIQCRSPGHSKFYWGVG
jgi:hypothetical protein